jgi:amino acid permease
MVIPLLQKELKKIKAVSIILFVALGVFLIVMLVQLGLGNESQNPDKDHSIYYQVKLDLALMTGLGILLCAYGFSQNLFPIYVSLEDQRTNNALKATGLGLGMSFLIYVSMGILSLYVFGSSIQESVLSNINAATSISSYIIRVMFMIVLACHIPYNFFAAKESCLIMIDEFRHHSMSSALEHTIQKSVVSELSNGPLVETPDEPV